MEGIPDGLPRLCAWAGAAASDGSHAAWLSSADAMDPPGVLLVAGAAAADAPSPPTVLLISVDGLGAEQFDPSVAPRIARLADEGVRAEWMVPAYPTLTFPNHYTLVTGLRPDRHGLVANDMVDPALGTFHSKQSFGAPSAWWEGGVPVWVTAERAGLRTATNFWPGSEIAIHGVRPWRWLRYADGIPLDDRVATTLEWLSLPPAERPRFTTLYFAELDQAAHRSGITSDAARQALAGIDAAIGLLLDGLDARGLRDAVDIVLVSDHGQVDVPVTNVIATDAMVDPAIATPVDDGQSIGFLPAPGREAEAEAVLLGAHAHYDCWRKGELPAPWRYGAHPRVPPIVCQLHPGWDAVLTEKLAWRRANGTRGSHGYDPAHPAMRAVFVASGPSFREGAVLPPLENVDVYPLLMHLLGLDPGEHDGSDAAFGALRTPAD